MRGDFYMTQRFSGIPERRPEVLAAFESIAVALAAQTGAWPQVANAATVPLGYDERDAKI